LGRDDVTYFSPQADPALVADRICAVLGADHQHALRKRTIREYAWDRILEMHLAPLLSEPFP
jgi:hypothetical protein